MCQDDLLTELEELEGQEMDEQLLAPSTAAPTTPLPSVPTARVPAQVSDPSCFRVHVCWRPRIKSVGSICVCEEIVRMC